MAAAVLAGPLCPGCAGTGDVNGVPCLDCGGRKLRVVPGSGGWLRKRVARLGHAVAAPAGTLVGWSMSLPGVAGAGAVSYGMAAVVHGVFHQVPELGVGLVVAGVFGLLADRRM